MSVTLPAGIDAGALLGLAGKVSQVFGSTDLTAVVPLAPCAFDADRLGRLSAPKTAEDVRLLAEFSQLVSLIPAGPLWVPGAGRPVWEPYLDVLDRAEVATSGPLSAADSERLAKALDYLYDEQDGIRVPTAELVAYRTLRDAWFTAAQEYTNRAAAADAPSSDDAKKAWQTQEQVLRAIVAERMAQWESDGHKDEVERCQEVERELGGRSPTTLFARLNKAVGPREVFFHSDTNGTRFVPTPFRPSGALAGGWPLIRVDSREYAGLAARAPASARAALGGSDRPSIGAMEFEYTSVGIEREWLSPALFASRHWRFAEPGRLLSDGADPPAGELPCFIAGLVLARNIAVWFASDAGPAPSGNGGSPLGFLKIPGRERPPGLLPKLPPLVLGGLSPGRPLTPAMALGPSPALDRRLRAARFDRIPLPDLPPPPSQTDRRVAPADFRTPPEHVYVVAFLVRRVTKCPDPQPGLLW